MGENPIIVQRILTILRYSEVFLIVEVVRPSFLTIFSLFYILRNSEVVIIATKVHYIKKIRYSEL